MKKFLILLAGGIFLSAWLTSCTEQSPLETQPQVAPSVQDATSPGSRVWNPLQGSTLKFKKISPAKNYKSRSLSLSSFAVSSLGDFEDGLWGEWTQTLVFVGPPDDEFGWWIGEYSPVWAEGEAAGTPIYFWNTEKLGFGGTTNGVSANSYGSSYHALSRTFELPPGVTDISLSFAIRWKNYDGSWEPASGEPTQSNPAFSGRDIVITLYDQTTNEEIYRSQASSSPQWAMASDDEPLPGPSESATWFSKEVAYKPDSISLDNNRAEHTILIKFERFFDELATGPLTMNLDEINVSYTLPVKSITVTANADQSKVYGEPDPLLSYTVFPALDAGDTFTGALSREAGENVGAYAINQGTLDAGPNYAITFVSANFSITSKPITVTAEAGQSKNYGEPDPTFTYSVSPALINGDVFSGALSRVPGEDVGTYAITQGNLTAGSNYSVTFVSADFEIKQLVVSIDIMPGSSVNPINLRSRGMIPVAILSTADFDATTVDGTTVLFAGASPSHGSGRLKDVDRDGDLDWLGHFKTQETNIQLGDVSAGLTGTTTSGQAFQGSDSIQVVDRGSKDDDDDDEDEDEDEEDKDKGKDHDKDKDRHKDKDRDKKEKG